MVSMANLGIAVSRLVAENAIESDKTNRLMQRSGAAASEAEIDEKNKEKEIANDVKSLSQDGRGSLRKAGVRFGAYHIYAPALLKPAPRALAAQLWSLAHGGVEGAKVLEEVAHLASSGRTSFPANPEIAKDLYRVAGFRVCGERAVRVDILERLADLIRPAVAYRPGVTAGDPPPGAADGNGFIVTVGMTSLAGCSGEAFASILKSLGFHMETRQGPAITVPLVPKAPTEPVQAKPAGEAGEVGETETADETAAEAAEIAAAEGQASEEAVLSAEQTDAEAPVEPEPAEIEAAVAEAVPEPVEEAVDEAPAEPPSDEAILAESALQSAVEEAVETVVAEIPSEAEAETAPTEPTTIEVWTPGRPHQRREGGRPQGRRPEKRAPREWIIPQRPERPERPKPAEGGEGERREGGRKFEGRPPREGGKPRFEGKPRQDRPRDNRAERPFASSERRERDKQPDPNSPFAKLLALKAELEKKK